MAAYTDLYRLANESAALRQRVTVACVVAAEAVRTESDQTAKSQSDQAPAQKHPPTAAMDKATPEKSSSETGAPAKHPPAASMERATPEQKSPGSAEAPKASK